MTSKPDGLFFTGANTGPSVLNSSVQIRLGYLRKVYGILSVQLAFTAIVSVMIMSMQSIQQFLFTK